MPNKQGGYGGYENQKPNENRVRHVRAPGSGGVRSAAQPPPRPHSPYVPGTGGRTAYPARQEPTAHDLAEDGWVRPEDLAPPPATPTQGAPRRSPPPGAARQRTRARLTRRQRRNRARLMLLGTVAGLFVLAGVITALLPKPQPAIVEPTGNDAPAMTEQLVAPLPYNGAEGDGATGTPALDWGFVGPIQQSESYTYTAAPATRIALPERGRVENSWFADAAFLGDSLTVGFSDYDIDVSGALICGYEGTSPNQIVNRTTLNNAVRGEEIPLEVLSAAQPAKLYVLLGTNALVGTGNDDGFLNYYGRMLDELKAALPNTMIFVQSVLPVRPEALEDAPGLATDRLATINAAIAAQCAEKGCYYLDLTEAFADESGALSEEIAQPDGIHITVAGYAKWVSYLATHTPYDRDNPYQPGSTYYLDDSMKQLLADLP